MIRKDDILKQTEKAKQRDGLTQRFETLGHFAGGLAHDFNNILSVVEGYTEIAVKKLRDGSLTEEHLLQILDATQRGAGITRQLLAFGQQNIALNKVVDLTSFLKQEERALKTALGHDMRITLHTPDAPCLVECNPDNMRQVLMHLTMNARDAMRGHTKEGCLSIAIEQSADDGFTLAFKDNGCGMNAEIEPQVFDPFFTTKEVGKGAGLGLSFVYGVVGQMDGRITLETRAGHGACFSLYLPRTEKEQADHALNSDLQDALSMDSLTGKTILVADDEDALRGVLDDMFSDMGMTVLTAENGNDALVLQDDYHGHIDFLLTDIVMRGMNGVRLADMFRTLRPQTDIVFMSGYPGHEHGADIALPEDAVFIAKPVRQDNLRKVLLNCLEKRYA